MMLGVALAIFSPVGRLLKALWSWTTANPMRLVIVALLALSGFLAISNASLRGDVRHLGKVIALRDDTIKDMVAANEAATKFALSEKARIEQEQKEISDAQDIDIRARIADAVARVRNKANRDSSGQADLPETSGPALDLDGAGAGSVDNDTLICVENTVKAQGWQEWYRAVSAAN